MPEAQLREHPVDAIRRLLDVLDEEDAVVPLRQEPRADDRREHGQFPAEQSPARFPRRDRLHAILDLREVLAGLLHVLERHGLPVNEHPLEPAHVEGVPLRCAVGAVEGDDPGPGVKGQQQRRDVAVADEGLGRPAKASKSSSGSSRADPQPPRTQWIAFTSGRESSR